MDTRDNIKMPTITRTRANSVDERRNSLDNLVRDFSDNSEKLAKRHETNKIKVIIEVLIKILESIKN